MKQIIMLISGVLLISNSVYSEPSKPISALMNTPATAFDSFLFQIQENSRCQTYFGNKDQPEMCMLFINYNYENNLIEMHFRALSTFKTLSGFKNSSEGQRLELMELSLSKLAGAVGLTEVIKGSGFKYGLIQTTPIRHQWSSKEININEVKEEIIKRTVLKLTYSFDGILYTAIRDHHGEILIKAKQIP